MKILKYLLYICIIISLSSGCQKNPEEDIVANKNENWIDNTKPDSENRIISEFKKFDEEFNGADNDVKIKASIEAEEINKKVIVYKCHPRDITMKEVQKWAEILFDGKEVYEPTREKSKSQLEESILYYKQIINRRDEILVEYRGDEQAVDEYIKYIEEIIKSLEIDYQTAADYVERKVTDWSFHEFSYYDMFSTLWQNTMEDFESLDKSLRFQATADINGNEGIINVVNRNEDDYLIHMLEFYYNDDVAMRQSLPLKRINVTDANKIVENIKNSLGFDNWVLDDCVKYNSDNYESNDDLYNVYSFTYVPQYDGYPLVYIPLLDITSEDIYASNLYYECLNIIVENEVVTNVTWYSPLNMDEIVLENAQLLDINDIYNRFKTQMQSEYSLSKLSDGFEKIDSAEILVNTLKFKLMRIKERGTDNFLVVPVWQFIGDIHCGPVDSTNVSLVIVNAMDGSIINGDLGY